MTRKIFFSFHYERDSWRAGQVRNSDLLPNEDEHGFIDAAAWEEIKRKGDVAIQNWIKEQLEGTSVTVVLIGAETSERPWVDYEIHESWERGNAIVGLYINGVKDQESKTDTKGANPLDGIYFTNDQPLSSVCKTYDWVLDDGRNNLGGWADQAAKDRAEYKGETKLKEGTVSSSHSTTPRLNNPIIPRITPSTGFVPHSPHSDYANEEQ